ncbi:MAG: insulinase family protein [Planctomycetes bacterium]|nr:insulinase family protein [Planctomycetota bacterium]
MMTRTLRALLCVALLAAPCLAQEAPPKLPARPEQIPFPPLSFEPPDPSAYRRELPGGVTVFLIPDRSLPLVDVRFTFRGGSYLDPKGKEGLAAAVGSMMRRGGAGDLDAAALDEEVDFLAAQLGTGAGEYELSASLDTLAQNLDKSLELMVAVLRRPRFQPDRFALWKSEVLERLKQRNDDAGSILGREWASIVYGPDHFKARQVTKASLDGLTEDDLRGFHRRWVHPGNLVVGVSGDFDPDAMLKKLAKALDGWVAAEKAPPPPQPTHALAPGVYRVEKDIPQGKVHIGMRSIKRDDPDYHALMVMSRILGSGGFTSRIMRRVRSDEGLAYDAGAAIIPGLYFPGEFRASFQSKSRTVALAAKLVLEEVEKIRTQPVEAQELEVAKGSLIETFPTQFESPAATLGVFMSDHLSGRTYAWWKEYRDKVRAVTPADIQRVAAKHLDPKAMAILIVGKWSEIEPGDLDGRAKMAEFFGGKATELPLRDPLTLEPLGR